MTQLSPCSTPWEDWQHSADHGAIAASQAYRAMLPYSAVGVWLKRGAARPAGGPTQVVQAPQALPIVMGKAAGASWAAHGHSWAVCVYLGKLRLMFCGCFGGFGRPPELLTRNPEATDSDTGGRVLSRTIPRRCSTTSIAAMPQAARTRGSDLAVGLSGKHCKGKSQTWGSTAGTHCWSCIENRSPVSEPR